VIFRRKILPSTPGVFATRVVTRGVDVTINVGYEHSRCQQYLKQGRALRIETVVKINSRSSKLSSRDGSVNDSGGIPPAFRNQHFALVNDMPTAAAACRHDSPARTADQNSRC
jgi:hypothetical protein